jgi:hypothetical protein
MAAFQAALAGQPLRIQIEVTQRVRAAIEEAQRDQREQKVVTFVQLAQSDPTYPDLKSKDLDDFLQELQDAFE